MLLHLAIVPGAGWGRRGQSDPGARRASQAARLGQLPPGSWQRITTKSTEYIPHQRRRPRTPYVVQLGRAAEKGFRGPVCWFGRFGNAFPSHLLLPLLQITSILSLTSHRSQQPATNKGARAPITALLLLFSCYSLPWRCWCAGLARAFAASSCFLAR